MAKGKHSAALFEVIHSDKRFRTKTDVPGHASLKTPKWWFKGREKAEESAPSPEPTPAELEADPTLATSTTFPASTEQAPKPVKLLPERNEISFKLTYTSAIIGAFSVVVIITLAYMIGTRGKPSPAVARAGQSTESLMKHPAQTGVLNLEKNEKTVSPGATKTSPTGAQVASPRATPTDANGQNSAQQVKPQATASNDDRFPIIGLNYVIAQCYPDQKDADRAAAALNERGLSAKVVRGPKGYANANWYSVVGTRGFDRIRNSPEYEAYVQQIVDIGALFTNDRKFKELKPRPYKWQAAY